MDKHGRGAYLAIAKAGDLEAKGLFTIRVPYKGVLRVLFIGEYTVKIRV